MCKLKMLDLGEDETHGGRVEKTDGGKKYADHSRCQILRHDDHDEVEHGEARSQTAENRNDLSHGEAKLGESVVFAGCDRSRIVYPVATTSSTAVPAVFKNVFDRFLALVAFPKHRVPLLIQVAFGSHVPNPFSRCQSSSTNSPQKPPIITNAPSNRKGKQYSNQQPVAKKCSTIV